MLVGKEGCSVAKEGLVCQGAECFGSSRVSLGTSHVGNGQLRNEGVQRLFIGWFGAGGMAQSVG